MEFTEQAGSENYRIDLNRNCGQLIYYPGSYLFENMSAQLEWNMMKKPLCIPDWNRQRRRIKPMMQLSYLIERMKKWEGDASFNDSRDEDDETRRWKTEELIDLSDMR